MGNNSLNKVLSTNKNKLVLMLTLVVICILSIGGYKVVSNNIATTKINYVKELISQEKYEEAIEEYSKYNDESLNKHISLIKDFIALSNIDGLVDKNEALLRINTEYSDILGEECFSSLGNTLKDIEIATRNSLNHIKEKEELFANELENKIEEAELILKELQETYIKEDFTELSKVLQEKKVELAKKAEEEALALAEKKAEEERLAKLEEESVQANKLTIANTNAAKNSEQIITVVSNGGSGSEVCRWEKGSDGNWIKLDSTFGYLGSGGMKYGPNVYNWDMCTPTGSYSLTEAFGNYSNPGTALSYRTLDGSEHWVDDEESEYYNTMQFGESNGRWNSTEHLSSIGKAYNYSIVIDYNRWPVSAAGSSAIFLHVSTGSPTWGCVAVEEYKMKEYLNWLEPSKNPRILLGFSYDEIYSNY